MNTNLLPTIILTILVLLLNPFDGITQNGSDQGIYVWEFSTRDGERNETTRSFTEEFEEALIQSQCCQVLQRRIISRLFDQKKNEKAIQSLEGLPAAKLENLKVLEAGTVVFGEIYDDTNSGQVKLSVNFESFAGKIVKKASTYLPKYALADPAKREEAVEALMAKLELAPKKPKPEMKQTLGDWEFSLTGCRLNGNNVSCGFIVTSRYRERVFWIGGMGYYTDGSTAYDEFGNEYLANFAQIGNQQSQSWANRRLVANIATPGNITFPNVSTRANKFPLLEFKVSGDDLPEQKIQFRNVVIE